jgi:hypothetical protein
MCFSRGLIRAHAKGRKPIHSGTFSKIPPKAASLEIIRRATASHGASIQVYQNEWWSAHSALPLCGASVASTCTNAWTVSARLWGSLTMFVLLAMPTHIWRQSVDLRSFVPLSFEDEQLWRRGLAIAIKKCARYRPRQTAETDTWALNLDAMFGG